MSEGTVVIITGKFDERVRDYDESNVIGTVVKLESDTVWVMLPDGNIWVGKKYLVYPIQKDDQCTTS